LAHWILTVADKSYELARLNGERDLVVETFDFIKLNFANAEANVRAYDTKSQIVLAATALSLSPIFFAIKQIDTSPLANLRLGALLVLFALVMLMFLRVIAPVSSFGAKDEPARKSLFFLSNPAAFKPDTYLDALNGADLALEYANEILVLQRIRGVKNRRFKHALYSLIGYFTIVLLYGLAIVMRIV